MALQPRRKESPVSLTAFDAKEQVRQASDIVAVVGSYLELRRQGRLFVARCPWHDDSRPSLQINPDRQSWKCWVCDIGGDVFNFIMRREGIDFLEALDMLADKAGIPLKQYKQQAPVEPGSAGDKKTLYAAMAWAEQQFHRFLLEGEAAAPARAYLDERKITRESIEKYHIGFAPKEFKWLVERARQTRFSIDVLKTVGLVGLSEKSGQPYDFFRGRVTFPIRDTQHRAIAFSARILPQLADEKSGGKYINTPQTRLYSKVDELYGLDVAANAVSRSRHIVVVEGQTDVIMANQHGVENVVAVCGTAIGPKHVEPRSLLRRYADRVTLVLDGDEAGQKRTNQVLELFVGQQIDLRIATLPDGLDPCEFLLSRGAEEFRTLLDAAPDALEHALATQLRGINIERDTHAASQALDGLLRCIAKAPRLSADTETASRMREGQILRRLARSFSESEDVIRKRLGELRAATPAPKTQHIDATPHQVSSEQHIPPASLTIEERELFEIFCLKPQLVVPALERVTREHLTTPTAEQLFAVYEAVVAEGEYPDAARVLTELEDSGLKNILVTLDWEAHERDPQSLHKPEQRLHALIERLDTSISRAEMQRVFDGRAKDDDALDIIRRTIEAQRQRMENR